MPALAIIGAGAFSTEATVRFLSVALGALGIAVCGIVRDRGKRLESALWESWGGSPTVRRLRWQGAQDERETERLHDRLNGLLEERLPEAAEEAADPADAELRYREAVAVLRELTRDTTRFRLVFAENMEYGFRRNSLGLRPVALAIAALTTGVSLVLLILGGGGAASKLGRWGLSALIGATIFIYW